MPAMDGVELVRKIHEKDKSIRFILMSAYEQTSIPESVGYEFIQKPIHIEKLKEIVFGIAQEPKIQQR